MVEFQSFSEDCKWRRSKVCKAIENYCEVDNCALYQMLESEEAEMGGGLKDVVAMGNFAVSERHPKGNITNPEQSGSLNHPKPTVKKPKPDAGDKALEKMGLSK